MYQGYLMFDGEEIVNTHRASAYAATAGFSWVEGCSECSSIRAVDPAGYVSPKLDVEKPPWWDPAEPDSMDFLGVIGISISNTDDSMRQLTTTESAGDGGYVGGLRYSMRTVVVRALLIATSDCALGFGLGWLRTRDTESSCATGQVGMYECCPHIPASDCSDPLCVEQCVGSQWRIFYEARWTSGPTVLRRREMSSRGWMAEVEFTITCGDPFRYGMPVVTADAVTPMTERIIEQTIPVQQPVDAFALAPSRMLPPSLNARTMPLPDEWLRQSIPVASPGHFSTVVPVVTLDAVDGPADDVRVTLMQGGQVRSEFRLSTIPAGGTVTVDFRARSVTTESNGVVRVNNAYARSVSGSPMRWPKRFPAGEYEVLVDRANGAPVTASVAFMGRVGA